MMISDIAKMTRLEFRRLKNLSIFLAFLIMGVIGYFAFILWGVIIGTPFFGFLAGLLLLFLMIVIAIPEMNEAYKIKKQINTDYGEMVERLEIIKKTL